MKKSGGKILQTMPQRLGKAIFYACSFILALVEDPARGENLPDPTRPPLVVQAPASSAAPTSGPILQSVLISPRHKVAIINGETVKLGGTYGTARVVKISEGSVVLSEGGSLQTLRLFPGVEKKIPQVEEANAPIGKKTPHSKRNAVRDDER
jgi:MSHA biogenesis protein MshK